jgi:hypothetical protein
MRRLAAAILLAWIHFALLFAAVTPAVASDANLPACCRKNGTHRCWMTQSSASGPGFQAALCPMYPRAGAVPGQAKSAGLTASASVFGVIASHPAVQPQTEARYRISFSRAGQKRGPPSFLA